MQKRNILILLVITLILLLVSVIGFPKPSAKNLKEYSVFFDQFDELKSPKDGALEFSTSSCKARYLPKVVKIKTLDSDDEYGFKCSKKGFAKKSRINKKSLKIINEIVEDQDYLEFLIEYHRKNKFIELLGITTDRKNLLTLGLVQLKKKSIKSYGNIDFIPIDSSNKKIKKAKIRFQISDIELESIAIRAVKPKKLFSKGMYSNIIEVKLNSDLLISKSLTPTTTLSPVPNESTNSSLVPRETATTRSAAGGLDGDDDIIDSGGDGYINGECNERTRFKLSLVNVGAQKVVHRVQDNGDLFNGTEEAYEECRKYISENINRQQDNNQIFDPSNLCKRCERRSIEYKCPLLDTYIFDNNNVDPGIMVSVTPEVIDGVVHFTCTIPKEIDFLIHCGDCLEIPGSTPTPFLDDGKKEPSPTPTPPTPKETASASPTGDFKSGT